MTQRVTQRDMILQYIDDFGSITPMQALNDIGCMRLAARIDELIDSGVKIRKEMVTDRNRYGKTCHYMRYSREA